MLLYGQHHCFRRRSRVRDAPASRRTQIYSKGTGLAFYLSTSKKKSCSRSLKEPSEREMTKPARKMRFSVYLTNTNLTNSNSEAATRLRPTWEMKVGKRFHGKAAGRKLFGFFSLGNQKMQGRQKSYRRPQRARLWQRWAHGVSPERLPAAPKPPDKLLPRTPPGAGAHGHAEEKVPARSRHGSAATTRVRGLLLEARRDAQHQDPARTSGGSRTRPHHLRDGWTQESSGEESP